MKNEIREIEELKVFNMIDRIEKYENYHPITTPAPTDRNMKLYMDKINEIVEVLNKLINV